MTIRDMKAFIDSLWDWEILDGCFGIGRIRPSDLDGIVERNGHFLCFETKVLNTQVPLGQYLTLKALVKIGFFTVMIIWGPKDTPRRLAVWDRNGEVKPYDADLFELRRRVADWYRWANKQSRI